jgi:hypothetical protein
MDELCYAKIIEFAEPLDRRRGSDLKRLGRMDAENP